MNETALATNGSDPREVALLKAIGFDKLAPEQRELALSIAKRYDLDPMLKHLVIIDGKPFVTRDGLLWVAHRSGQLDGIEVTKPVLIDNYWECDASVYRKDMSRPFTFPGRFPKAGRNAAYAPEMAIKCAESMALRRAFNVAAATVDEQHGDVVPADVPSQSAAAPSLAERAAAKAAIVVDSANADAARGGADKEPTAQPLAPTASPVVEGAPGEPATPDGPAVVAVEATVEALGSRPSALCGSPSPFGDGAVCGLLPGHKSLHRQLDVSGKVVGSWPDR